MKNSDIERMAALVEKNSVALNRITNMTLPSQSYSSSIPEMIIARKWNSWYPSYFDVEGGGYIFVFRSELVAIDPGFRFTGIIRELGINPLKIRVIFLTHLHPDHFAGLIEYITLRRELALIEGTKNEKKNLDIYLNEASFNFFNHILGGFVSLKHVIPGSRIKIYSKENKNTLLCKVEVLRAYHREQGGHFSSIGLILSIPTPTKTYTIGVMSDTDGSEEYMNEYYQNYNKVDVLIPHVGTIEPRKRPSGEKHLYLEGLKEIVNRLVNPRLFVLGEFGLEMGSLSSIIKSVNPFIIDEAERIFRESIRELFKVSSNLHSGLLIITSEYIIQRKTNIEFLMILIDEISKFTKEDVWLQAKSSWVKKEEPNNLSIKFPSRIQQSLSLDDPTSVRRTWNYLRLYEEGIRGYIDEISKFIKNLMNTGFGKSFNDTTKVVDLSIFFNRTRAIIERLKRPRKRFSISKSLNEAVKAKSYEQVRAIVDQITTTWIILRLSLAYQSSSGKQEESSEKDYRNEVSEYFDSKMRDKQQRMIPGEFGTKIRFGTSIKILAHCYSCKNQKKYVSLKDYAYSTYDTEKETIIHYHKGECKYCRYLEVDKRAYYESQTDSEEYERWQEEQALLLEQGAYAYFINKSPSDLGIWLTQSPHDLTEILYQHLCDLDEVLMNLLHSERITMWRLKCKNCNESIFKLNNFKEGLQFDCAMPSCKQDFIIPIDEKISIESDFKRYSCSKCNRDIFEFALGFEYVREDKLEVTEDDYSKIHIAYYCYNCETRNTICCTTEMVTE